jgi:hypothetical protein
MCDNKGKYRKRGETKDREGKARRGKVKYNMRQKIKRIENEVRDDFCTSLKCSCHADVW